MLLGELLSQAHPTVVDLPCADVDVAEVATPTKVLMVLPWVSLALLLSQCVVVVEVEEAAVGA